MLTFDIVSKRDVNPKRTWEIRCDVESSKSVLFDEMNSLSASVSEILLPVSNGN